MYHTVITKNLKNIEINSIILIKVPCEKKLCAEDHIDELLPYQLNALTIFVRLIKKLNSVLGRYEFLFYLIKSRVLVIIMKGILFTR